MVEKNEKYFQLHTGQGSNIFGGFVKLICMFNLE